MAKRCEAGSGSGGVFCGQADGSREAAGRLAVSGGLSQRSLPLKLYHSSPAHGWQLSTWSWFSAVHVAHSVMPEKLVKVHDSAQLPGTGWHSRVPLTFAQWPVAQFCPLLKTVRAESPPALETMAEQYASSTVA